MRALLRFPFLSPAEGGGGAGGGAPAGPAPGDAVPAAAATPPPAPAAPPPAVTPADPAKLRQEAYARQGWTGEVAQQADRMLDLLERMDPAERAMAVDNYVRQQAAVRQPQTPPAGKTAAAAADEGEGPPADPRMDRLEKLILKQAEVLDSLLGERKAVGEREAKAAARKNFAAAVDDVVERSPALKGLRAADKSKALDRARQRCLGFIAQHTDDDAYAGLSTEKKQRALLEAWAEDETEAEAERQGLDVKALLTKLAANADTQTNQGGGRPPAQTEQEPRFSDLFDGTARERAKRELVNAETKR